MTHQNADLLLINADILTQDLNQPRVTQMRIQGNRIQAVGAQASDGVGRETKILDMQGAILLPGFIDSHLHLLWGGETLFTIPGHQANSRASLISLIRHFAENATPGSWLRGGGWNEHLFQDGSYPHKSWLDEAAPGHPLLLHRHDGHSAVASSAALDLAGISASTPDPVGGVIDRDAQGEPTGILRDAAMGLVSAHEPPETEAEMLHCLEVSQAYLLQRGVTAVGDMSHNLEHFRFLQKMARAGRLKVRISAYLPILKWPEIKILLQEGIFEDEWLQFKGLKGFCDGSLGSHTALMLEPYDDTPHSVGIYDRIWSDPQAIQEIISEADQRGYQTVIHAIGDRAVREVLDLFENVISRNGSRDRRFRVEHAQHVHPADQKRFKVLDVIASVQPQHCLDDSRYAEGLLGARCSYAYPFASLLKSETILALGSDWPVSPADPLATIHGSIQRAGWYMEQAMTLAQALRAHTLDAAYAGFRDGDLGCLRAGYLADFVVLDPRILELENSEELPENLIQAVWSNGAQITS